MKLASSTGQGDNATARSKGDASALRWTFNTAADRYERARPSYPPLLFDDLAGVAGLKVGSHVLEVGAGTGQATIELARRGYSVTAIELGENLAAIARRKLADWPKVTIEVADFDRWPLPVEPFDAIAAFTAFRWLDPTTGARKIAAALPPGGIVAIVDTHHVAGGTEQFFVDVQTCYERWDPATEPGLRLPPANEVTPDATELQSSDLFGHEIAFRYEWTIAYRTAEYLDLLQTYSGHIALPEPARAGLLGCIEQLIDEVYDGSVEKAYLTTLLAAPRL